MNVQLGSRSTSDTKFDGRVNKGSVSPIMEHAPSAQIADADHRVALFLSLAELDSLADVLARLRDELVTADAEWLARHEREQAMTEAANDGHLDNYDPAIDAPGADDYLADVTR